MEIYACGLNSHGQLCPSRQGKDLSTFTKIAESSNDLDVFFTSWSQTALLHPPTALEILGFDSKLFPRPSRQDDHESLTSPFGDESGLIGALTTTGSLRVTNTHNLMNATHGPRSMIHDVPITSPTASPDPHPHSNSTIAPTTTVPCLAPPFGSPPDADHPRIAHVATTAAGRVAVAFLASPASNAIHVAEFDDAAHLCRWYVAPAAEVVAPSAHHMLPGRVAGLVGVAAGWGLLTVAGEVWTWGDGRYGACLGRDGEPGKPGRVEGVLGGLKVVKLVAGGWVMAALSEAGEGFVWGLEGVGSGGEKGNEMGLLKRAREEGEVVGRVVLSGEDDEEEVVDLAVGNGHLLALDGKGRVWSVGGNENGQLGLGKESEFEGEWTRVVGLEGRVVKVYCGDKTSFAVVSKE